MSNQQPVLLNQEEEIVTGEAVAVELPAANIGHRILGCLLDVLATAGVIIILTMFIFPLIFSPTYLSTAIMLSIGFVMFILPATIETLTKGKSLGKYVMGTRVVREDLGPISFTHALTRSLLGFIEIWLSSGSIAMLVAVSNTKGKRVGDFVAGTQVIRERVNAFGAKSPFLPPQLADWSATADIAPLPADLAITIRQLLIRANLLSPHARDEILLHTSQQLSNFVAPPPPPGTSAYDFLCAVQAERREREIKKLASHAELRKKLSTQT